MNGTLAKITNQYLQNRLTVIIPNSHKRGQDFWIAGKRRKIPNVKASGVYWLNSASSKFYYLMEITMMVNITPLVNWL